MSDGMTVSDLRGSVVNSLFGWFLGHLYGTQETDDWRSLYTDEQKKTAMDQAISLYDCLIGPSVTAFIKAHLRGVRICELERMVEERDKQLAEARAHKRLGAIFGLEDLKQRYEESSATDAELVIDGPSAWNYIAALEKALEEKEAFIGRQSDYVDSVRESCEKSLAQAIEKLADKDEEIERLKADHCGDCPHIPELKGQRDAEREKVKRLEGRIEELESDLDSERDTVERLEGELERTKESP